MAIAGFVAAPSEDFVSHYTKCPTAKIITTNSGGEFPPECDGHLLHHVVGVFSQWDKAAHECADSGLISRVEPHEAFLSLTILTHLQTSLPVIHSAERINLTLLPGSFSAVLGN